MNDNAVSAAFAGEINSGMDRGDLAELTAFAAARLRVARPCDPEGFKGALERCLNVDYDMKKFVDDEMHPC
jgi:hypothetical protein